MSNNSFTTVLPSAHLAGAMNAMADAAAQPREIGIIDRVNGLAGGTTELADRIQFFVSRIHNLPPTADPKKDTPPLGLSATIAEAESQLRRCFEMLNALNDAF